MKSSAQRLSRLLLVALMLAGLSLLAACRSNDGPRGRALRVGVAPSHPPLVFEQAGEVVGIEADLARALGERLGRPIVFERRDEDGLLDALERGEVDIVMSGLAIRSADAARVRFARPYMEGGQLALIRTVDLARFGRIHTIRQPGARVGYQSGAAGEHFVATELVRSTSFGFDDVASGLRSLRAGRIDFFVHDAPTVWRIAADPAQRDLQGLYQRLTREELGWAVRRGDDALLGQLDEAVGEWQRDGRIESIIDRWIPVRVTLR